MSKPITKASIADLEHRVAGVINYLLFGSYVDDYTLVPKGPNANCTLPQKWRDAGRAVAVANGWERAWVAVDEDGDVCAYESRPSVCHRVWSTESEDFCIGRDKEAAETWETSICEIVIEEETK